MHELANSLDLFFFSAKVGGGLKNGLKMCPYNIQTLLIYSSLLSKNTVAL